MAPADGFDSNGTWTDDGSDMSSCLSQTSPAIDLYSAGECHTVDLFSPLFEIP